MYMMENKANLQKDDNEDALSFRDLPITSDNEDGVVSPHEEEEEEEPRNSDFEFAGSAEEPHRAETLVFCGELIAGPPSGQNELYVRHPRNGLFIRRDSFKRSHSFRASQNDAVASSSSGSAAAVSRSSSVRFGPSFGSSRAACVPSTPGRHKAVIGVVKIQSKMEMSDIRKRQSRRIRAGPVTMFAAGSGGSGEVVPAVAGHGEEGVVVEKSQSNHHQWGLFKPLRSSAHLVGALTKFGCLPHA